MFACFYPLVIATIFVGSLDGRLLYGTPKESDVIAAREGYVDGFNDRTHCPDWCYEQLTAVDFVAAKDFGRFWYE